MSSVLSRPGVTVERLALAFSDGSMTVLRANTHVSTAMAERLDADRNQRDDTKLTSIVRVRVEVLGEVR